MPDRLHRAVRALAPVALAPLLILAGAGAAGASVILDARDRHPGARDVGMVLSVEGDYADGHYRSIGPNEPTSRIVLTWPGSTPVVGLTAPHFDGWSTTVTTTPDGTTTVTWVGGVLNSGTRILLPLHVDALPQGTGVDATVEQDYADGRVEQWSDPHTTDAFDQPLHPEAYLPLDGVITSNFPVPVDPTAAGDRTGGAGNGSSAGTYAAIGGGAVLVLATAAGVLVRRRTAGEPPQAADAPAAWDRPAGLLPPVD